MNYGSVREGRESTRDALPLCRAWLRNCVKSHRHCNHHGERWKPTRLLKIDGDVQVALASELEGYPSYATLSHCWGSLNFTTLTRNNLEQFRVRVPFEALTKSFQDAIYITRYLGLQYLWIDSLCILQDDPSDWRKESSLMSSAYGSSTVNIAATSASDGTMGCFFDRHASWRSQMQVTKDRNTLWDCYTQHNTVLGESPLRSRGWVVQENFLSRRILHFTHREVFWECDEKIAWKASLKNSL
jgi:Heterokaryon incompatibility protein (HET)